MIFTTRYKAADGQPMQVRDPVVERTMAQLRQGPTLHSEAGAICASVCNHLAKTRIPFKLEFSGRGWTLELVK